MIRFGGLALLMTSVGAAGIAGCSGGDSTPANGSVSVSLMDRPVDGLTHLYVTITEVWLKPAGGPAFQLPMTTTPLTVNLLELGIDTASVLVDEAVVAAGSYNWMELVIDDSSIDKSYALTTVGGMELVDVDVPSDTIRLVSGFDVGANQALRVLLDWDVRKGLTNAVGTGEFKLRPAFRILDVNELSVVSGSVLADTLVAESSCSGILPDGPVPVVYVFGAGEVPDEIDAIGVEPITTVESVYDGIGNYDYRVVLMPGDYVLAATCEAALDLDAQTDGITLFPTTAGGYAVEGIAVSLDAGTPLEGVDFLD